MEDIVPRCCLSVCFVLYMLLYVYNKWTTTTTTLKRFYRKRRQCLLERVRGLSVAVSRDGSDAPPWQSPARTLSAPRLHLPHSSPTRHTRRRKPRSGLTPCIHVKPGLHHALVTPIKNLLRVYQVYFISQFIFAT